MEVIFAGLKQTPEMVVSAAIQEDVDVVGISSLSAGHTRSLPRLARPTLVSLISVSLEEESSIFAFSAASFRRCIAIASFARSIP